MTASVSDSQSASDAVSVHINAPVNQPPDITLTSPGDNDSFVEGDTVMLRASASVDVSDLTVGSHVITARVVDGHGESLQREITITVNSAGGGTPFEQRFEAEDATIVVTSGGHSFSSNPSSFSGRGVYTFKWNAFGHFEWRVNVPSAQTYQLQFGYDLYGGDTLIRDMMVEVDGVDIEVIDFDGTGTFWNVQEKFITLNLSAGEHILRLKTNPQGGMTLDYMDVVSESAVASIFSPLDNITVPYSDEHWAFIDLRTITCQGEC